MELALLVYAIGLLGNFNGFLAFCLGGSISAIFIWLLSDNVEKIKFWATVSFCLGLILVIVPSEKTAYTMIGAYAAQKVSKDENVQKLSGKVLTIIEQKMNEYIEEGSSRKHKK